MTCDREVEGDVAHQVGPPRPTKESISSLTTTATSSSSQRASTLERKLVDDQGPGDPVLGLVHLQDGAPHHPAHDALVDPGGVGLVVPEHLDHLVEAEHRDRRRAVGVGRAAVAQVDRAAVHRRFPPQLVHPRIRVADVPADHVLQLERIEGHGLVVSRRIIPGIAPWNPLFLGAAGART